MRYLIFDAGALISLTMNGLLPILEKLKKQYDGEFIITPAVKREIIDRPLKIKKYSLEGVKMRDLLNRGILKLSSRIVPNSKLDQETKRLLRIANSAFRVEESREKINLIQEGEAACLAFANLCKCNNAIVIDERTTRMLTEAPDSLRRLFEKKLSKQIRLDERSLKEFKNFRFIRSAEVLFIAFKKGLFDLKADKTLLDALLYGVKFKGAAISSKEIEEMKKLI
ncbi:hypothetical protein HOA55_03720 [archaeon]|jgi:hypothetical protein|nr:hypothetical protein [archaeon]MBT3577319.1 hypothetical protein [archaeon]MBT6820437.1 hypothetical protein [archaeon]MBT6956262.1 hypothetical protein [archaeon]MBT7025251.1 hypothetical protein [archaeon]